MGQTAHVLLVRHGIQGEGRIRIVPVEVDGDLFGDNLDELPLELLYGLVRRGDTTITREQDLSHIPFPDGLGRIAHVVDR